jgi:hypothetical protein
MQRWWLAILIAMLAEIIVDPSFVWVGSNDIPRDVRILAEKFVVPGFVLFGCNDIRDAAGQ